MRSHVVPGLGDDRRALRNGPGRWRPERGWECPYCHPGNGLMGLRGSGQGFHFPGTGLGRTCGLLQRLGPVPEGHPHQPQQQLLTCYRRSELKQPALPLEMCPETAEMQPPLQAPLPAPFLWLLRPVCTPSLPRVLQSHPWGWSQLLPNSRGC